MIPGWAVASLLANVAIIAIEYLNRHWGGAVTYWGALRLTGPLIVLAQFGLWYTWRHCPHLLAGWLVFTIGNSLIRLLMVSLYTHESFAWWTPAGIGLMICGAFVVKEGLRYGG